MRAILTFNLPEEKDEYEMALKGRIYYCVVWDILELLSEKAKYGDSDMVDIHKLRDEIYQTIDDEVRHEF